jgi:hypothetical protein
MIYVGMGKLNIVIVIIIIVIIISSRYGAYFGYKTKTAHLIVKT